jgi:Spy/CpxP family protein refolding chaperone
MQRLSALLVLVLAACSSSDYDRPQDRPPVRGSYGEPARVRDTEPALLEIVPGDSWWREPRLAEPLNLSTDQFQALEKIANDDHDEIARLERDLPIAQRDLRTAIEIDPPSRADITTAGDRVRNIRDSLFDRQVQMLAAERLVLTKQQWSKLLDELDQRRRDERVERNNANPRGGRGGYPRGGRGRPW